MKSQAGSLDHSEPQMVRLPPLLFTVLPNSHSHYIDKGRCHSPMDGLTKTINKLGWRVAGEWHLHRSIAGKGQTQTTAWENFPPEFLKLATHIITSVESPLDVLSNMFCKNQAKQYILSEMSEIFIEMSVKIGRSLWTFTSMMKCIGVNG